MNMLSHKLNIRLQHFDFIHIMRFLKILKFNRKKNAISFAQVFLQLALRYIGIQLLYTLNNSITDK